MHKMEVLVLCFDLQNYERKEIWLTIFQVDKVTSPLPVVLQSHEKELMKSLTFSKY